jgi:hypothetical protein
LIIGCSLSLLGQKTIAGVVTLEDRKLEGATVTVSTTKNRTKTDHLGAFDISTIAEKTCILKNYLSRSYRLHRHPLFHQYIFHTSNHSTSTRHAVVG